VTRMELALENGRPAREMDNQELDQALRSATALLNLNPALPVRITLAQFIAEAQRELNKRPDAEGYHPREAQDFTDAELDAAIQHATDLREARPRHGVQLVMANFQLGLMLEREQRRQSQATNGDGPP
jgi:hypothetical protein